jgi:hypothetical protein
MQLAPGIAQSKTASGPRGCYRRQRQQLQTLRRDACTATARTAHHALHQRLPTEVALHRPITPKVKC